MLRAQSLAVQINAQTYASRWCEMRAAGATLQEAGASALEVSRTDPGLPTQVIRNGKRFNSDILAAVDLARSRC